jgi:hypothetical protein
MRVVAVRRDGEALVRRVDLAARHPTAVISQNGKTIDQLAAKSVGRIGVAMSSGQNQQQWT